MFSFVLTLQLLLKSTAFIEAIVDLTQGTETDKASKALMFIFMSKGRGLELLKMLFARELKLARKE